MIPRFGLLLLLTLGGSVCQAQWHDDFEDDELQNNPTWHGDISDWRIETYAQGRRLRSNGHSVADTLVLTTESALPYGTWTAHYGYRQGTLTNFNHVRLILWTSTPNLLGFGYMLQVGANDRTIRLFEFDAGIASRKLLAAAPVDELEHDSTELAIYVERSYRNLWAVSVNNRLVMSVESAQDIDAQAGFFGVWVKHTSARGADHWFDDVGATPAVLSDTTGPRIVRAVADSRTSVKVDLGEPLFSAVACQTETYTLLPVRRPPTSVDCIEALVVDSLVLHFEDPLPNDARLATALTDPSGNATVDTLAIDLSRLARLPLRDDVVINEINYAPTDSENEFVEILNTSDRELDLSGVVLTDDRTRVAIGVAALAAGDFLTLTRDSLGVQRQYGITNAVQLAPWPTLNNAGDRVSLVTSPDTLDAVPYEPSWNDGTNSLERRDPMAPSGFPGNWGSSTDPLGATPGRRNSIYAVDRVPPGLAYAGLLPGLPKHVSVHFSEDIEIARLHVAQFSLNGQPAQRIVQGDETYSSRSILQFAAPRPGTLRATNLADPSGNTAASSEVRLHLRPGTGDVVINEIMYQPLADRFDGLPDQPEYVEVRSLSSEPVAIDGCAVTGRTAEDGTRSEWRLPDGPTGIPPHALAALVGTNDIPMLRQAFELDSRAHVMPVQGGGLNLPSERSPLQLECPNAGRIDSVMYDPAWHDGALLSTRGRSLERIDVHAPSNDPTNWTTSRSPIGGTPAQDNSVMTAGTVRYMHAGSVVITELLFEPRSDDGAAPQYEYIEIYNRSDETVDLNGARFLEGRLDSTGNGARFVFAPSPLAPREYGLAMIVPSAAGETEPRELLARAFPSTAGHQWPLFVLRRSGLALPNDGGLLALLNRTSEVVDRIVYSPDAHHPHLAESRGIALERISSDSPGEHPLNWSSSVHPEGGTPGRRNSVSAIGTGEAGSLAVSPSPFTPDGDGDRDHVVITYNLRLPRPMVRLTVFDSRGRRVRRVTTGLISAPTGSIVWNGFNDHGGPVSPGIYIVYLQAVDKKAGLTEEHKGVVVAAPPID